jgi:hypothetical protein
MIQVHGALFMRAHCLLRPLKNGFTACETCFTDYAKLTYYQWKKLEKGSTRNKTAFAEASKEVTYEESCLRDSYSHNGHLSHKPIVQ